ncbi:MAG: ImmA/IrrE family metallo-endopeptidase, partial [Proteobacteria bacterium]|nr:ImmA/IrrE family metallo-endopeptidase [Pseudomonadota bacterium]
MLSLGIDNPKDIDLEAIAYCAGAEVRRRKLDTCEARIVGFGDQAIITVNRTSYGPRLRFSIGHELGHWEHHRGRSFVCRREDIGATAWDTQATLKGPLDPERVADAYAADLLMPEYLFLPRAARTKRPNFQFIDELAAEFETSRLATAIRMVDAGTHPLMLVCHAPGKRAWFRRGKDVPSHWFPRDELDPESPT